jgi:hypothetical protein
VGTLASSSSPAAGLDGLDGGGILCEGARRGGMLEVRGVEGLNLRRRIAKWGWWLSKKERKQSNASSSRDSNQV